MKNYIQPGKALTIMAAAAVLSGELVVQGHLVGVAGADADVGQQVAIHLEGVYALPKPSAEAWAVGDAIYADPDTGDITKVETEGHLLIGAAAADATSPSATGHVRLSGAPTVVIA
ncbi:DUF2190 family protein [Ketogulonicigenium vulgare]|uniref:DUF2190 family protein n=1 Tax=Ketogulonicigenium vulgare TaxID=92945 RepID=UPI0023598784|nr:DUF2190 family protein [Ketogulonicigenium vulgare]